MKIVRVTCYLFALLLALVAFAFAPSAPQAHASGPGNTTKFSFHGQTAFATFDSVSPDGCVETFVNVDATQSGKSPVADLFIGQFDLCTGTFLLSATGSTTSADFQVGHRLASASLQATIPVFDAVSGTTFEASVSMTWTATSPIARENQSVHFQSQGFIENLHLNSTFRDATASGSVSIGATDFTPGPPALAQIASVKEGEVTITHA